MKNKHPKRKQKNGVNKKKPRWNPKTIMKPEIKPNPGKSIPYKPTPEIIPEKEKTRFPAIPPDSPAEKEPEILPLPQRT